MSLDSALSIATGGLANINAQFQVISQNIANAGTPGYVVEVSSQQAITADGMALGVHTGGATLQIDHALQAAVLQQNATTAGLQTTQTALQAIDGVLGTPGSGSDLGSLLGNLQNGFSTLLSNPGSQPQQTAVIAAATTLAQGINSLSSAYAAQRQAAQDSIGSTLDTLNATLATIGQISNQIIALKSTPLGTADLENQRNASVQTLSNLLNIKTVEQPNGDLSIYTSNGLVIPTRDGARPFAIANTSTAPAAFYPGGGVPGIMLDGADVTSQMTGGQIGANIVLRDTTIPTAQAELDEFAQGLSSRFQAQGLTLFSDPSGNVAAGGGTPSQDGYIGYAGIIQVNPAVIANPSLVRDGTDAITASTTGATAFSPNPVDGPAGFTGMISRILNFTFGNQVQAGVSQPPLNVSGLGASGTLSAAFNANGNALSTFATNLVASQSQLSARITTSLGNEQALQTSLTARVSTASGVNMDSEMSKMLTLQNAYSVNARVIAAVRSMFTELLQAVQ
jgi:flagellar hook-associated protein 1